MTSTSPFTQGVKLARLMRAIISLPGRRSAPRVLLSYFNPDGREPVQRRKLGAGAVVFWKLPSGRPIPAIVLRSKREGKWQCNTGSNLNSVFCCSFLVLKLVSFLTAMSCSRAASLGTPLVLPEQPRPLEEQNGRSWLSPTHYVPPEPEHRSRAMDLWCTAARRTCVSIIYQMDLTPNQ